jgi:hypothetical protein
MSEDKIPPIAAAILTPEQIESISGGNSCTVGDYLKMTSQLKTAYEDLVDFTSYVIERVAK